MVVALKFCKTSKGLVHTGNELSTAMGLTEKEIDNFVKSGRAINDKKLDKKDEVKKDSKTTKKVKDGKWIIWNK